MKRSHLPPQGFAMRSQRAVVRPTSSLPAITCSLTSGDMISLLAEAAIPRQRSRSRLLKTWKTKTFFKTHLRCHHTRMELPVNYCSEYPLKSPFTENHTVRPTESSFQVHCFSPPLLLHWNFFVTALLTPTELFLIYTTDLWLHVCHNLTSR